MLSTKRLWRFPNCVSKIYFLVWYYIKRYLDNVNQLETLAHFIEIWGLLVIVSVKSGWIALIPGATTVWSPSSRTSFIVEWMKRYRTEQNINAPWFRLCLPSCGPGFESQAHHLRFFSICIIEIVMKSNENKQKEAMIGPFKKISTLQRGKQRYDDSSSSCRPTPRWTSCSPTPRWTPWGSWIKSFTKRERFRMLRQSSGSMTTNWCWLQTPLGNCYSKTTKC